MFVFSLPDLSHSVWWSLVSSTSLELIQMCSFYDQVIFHGIYVPQLLHPFICQWTSSCFHVLAIANSAEMNIRVHVSFPILIFLVYMPSRGNTGLYGIFIPSFLRTLHTVVHRGYICLHSHQQCKRAPFSPHPSPAIFVCRFFDNGHSDRCEVISPGSLGWHFSTSEQYWTSFMHLLAICMSSLENAFFFAIILCVFSVF